MITLTTLGQESTDSVTISRDQQRECIKWYYDNQFKDSIIIFKDSIILNQTEFIETADEIVDSLDKSLSETKLKLDKMKKKRIRGWFFGCGIGILSTIIAVLAIS